MINGSITKSVSDKTINKIIIFELVNKGFMFFFLIISYIICCKVHCRETESEHLVLIKITLPERK